MQDQCDFGCGVCSKKDRSAILRTTIKSRSERSVAHLFIQGVNYNEAAFRLGRTERLAQQIPLPLTVFMLCIHSVPLHIVNSICVGYFFLRNTRKHLKRFIECKNKESIDRFFDIVSRSHKHLRVHKWIISMQALSTFENFAMIAIFWYTKKIDYIYSVSEYTVNRKYACSVFVLDSFSNGAANG